MRHPTTRSNGWALLDAIIGLTAIAVIVTGLIIASGQQRRAAQAMAEQRQLVRDAELAATQMQMDREVTVDDLATEPIGDGWVRVTIERDGRTAELFAPVGEGVTP